MFRPSSTITNKSLTVVRGWGIMIVVSLIRFSDFFFSTQKIFQSLSLLFHYKKIKKKGSLVEPTDKFVYFSTMLSKHRTQRRLCPALFPALDIRSSLSVPRSWIPSSPLNPLSTCLDTVSTKYVKFSRRLHRNQPF